MRAPRNRALMISRRCCSPMVRSPTSASGSRRRRNCRPISASRAARAGAVEPAGRALAADHQVLQHAMARHEMEMLMHHADAERERIGGVADMRPAGRRSAMLPASAA